MTMQPDLSHLTVEKRPDRIRFEGRILYLVDDADLVRRQLEGEYLELTDEIRSLLRDQISTDEITPAYICYYYDETLGLFPYPAFQAGGELPITRGRVKESGFVWSLSSARRGKASYRARGP